MWEWILYLLAIYGIVSIWVYHFSGFKWWERAKNNPLHFVILLKDSQRNIEWVFRSLMNMSYSTGKPIRLTFVDFGSQDDTLFILNRLSHGKYAVTILSQSHCSQEWLDQLQSSDDAKSHLVFIDLRKSCLQGNATV